MRRTIFAGILTGIAFVAVAAPATAFDRHFTVIGKTTSFHNSPNSFRFTDKLLSPLDRDNRVGRDRGECTKGQDRGDKLKCKAVIYLNGELGGFGYIHVKGNLGRHDDSLNVVSGSGGFDGVAGKLILGEDDQLHFDLVR